MNRNWVAIGLAIGVASASVQGAIILNEVLANNVSLSVDGQTTDWVELYNPDSAAVDVGGMSLSSEPPVPNQWVFPIGTVVPSHGFLVVNCDSGQPATAVNTGFGLGANGDSVYLFDANGSLVDKVTFGVQAANYSIGRLQVVGGTWQLMTPTRAAANQPCTLGSQYGLKINEWMANPLTGKTWFEIYNPATNPVALGGLYLTDNLKKPLKTRIPDLSYIGVGTEAFQKFIADGSSTNGPNHADFKLSSSGEDIGLFTASGPIDHLTYGPQAAGVSQGRLPDGSANVAFFPDTPTPGTSNYLPLKNVVINEVLSHSDPPLEDAIELYNPTDAEVPIGGWYLSDSPSNLKKFQIPTSTKLTAHGYAVFYEYQFGNPASPMAFFFNSSEGDTAFLSQADVAGNLTGVRTWQDFGASANGVSFGRFTNSVGQVDFVAMSQLSFGSTVVATDPPSWTNLFVQGPGGQNPYPIVGPVVVSEIMYHPQSVVAGQDNVMDEFIELHNITATNALLYTPTEITNTWRLRGGIGYDFPMNVSIPPGGYLLVVNFDPVADPAALATFRSKYACPDAVNIYGPYSGKLGNNGDTITLEKPDPVQGMTHPNAGFVPHVVVERIEYLNSTLWPAGADQTGFSLQRTNDSRYGNDPANWFAAAPTAGRANTSTTLDQDKDGLPDDWELTYGLNPHDPLDAALDSDGDGLTNLEEYQCGTNPRDPASVLRLLSISRSGAGVTLRFEAIAGKPYTVEYSDGASTGWTVLSKIAPGATNRVEEVQDAGAANGFSRLYRLAEP